MHCLALRLSFASSAVLLVCLVVSGLRAQPPADSPPTNDPVTGTAPEVDQAELEAGFAERLSGATLVGHFTDSAAGEALTGERYTLGEVRKLQGDRWLIPARIQYGDHDVTLPLALPVKWAGDTPVIVVDKIGFPGLGTYTARVLIYEDRYAGFWKGQDCGGHLFGTIEKAAGDDQP